LEVSCEHTLRPNDYGHIFPHFNLFTISLPYLTYVCVCLTHALALAAVAGAGWRDHSRRCIGERDQILSGPNTQGTHLYCTPTYKGHELCKHKPSLIARMRACTHLVYRPQGPSEGKLENQGVPQFHPIIRRSNKSTVKCVASTRSKRAFSPSVSRIW
jgi:hypothetical protein